MKLPKRRDILSLVFTCLHNNIFKMTIIILTNTSFNSLQSFQMNESPLTYDIF